MTIRKGSRGRLPTARTPTEFDYKIHRLNVLSGWVSDGFKFMRDVAIVGLLTYALVECARAFAGKETRLEALIKVVGDFKVFVSLSVSISLVGAGTVIQNLLNRRKAKKIEKKLDNLGK